MNPTNYEALQRTLILLLLADGDKTLDQLYEKTGYEPSVILRLTHALGVAKLVAFKPLGRKQAARYDKARKLLFEVLAQEKPVTALKAYADCAPIPLQITRIGRAALAA